MKKTAAIILSVVLMFSGMWSVLLPSAIAENSVISAPEGIINFDNFNEGDHLTYIEVTPVKGSTPNYPEGGKWGVISNNGYITYSDVNDTNSKVANTYAETIYKADGTSATQTEHQGRRVSSWTYENNLTVSTSDTDSSNKFLEIKSADMAYATGFEIDKAGQYTLTYYVNDISAIKNASSVSTGTNFGSAVLSTINIGVNRTGSDVYYTDSTKSATISAQLPNHLKNISNGAWADYTFDKFNSASDINDAMLINGETWYKVTHSFETKEAHQKVYFAICNNTGSTVYIDDIVLSESIDPEGVNSFETFTVGDHLTYIEATPVEGSTPNYPEGGKWGVVSNNGYITYSDVNDTKSKVANTYAETIYKADGTSAVQTEHQGRKVSGWTYENNLTVSTAKAHSGNKSFEIKSADMAYATGFEIDKAGQYTLTYYVNDISAIKNASSMSTGTNFGSAVLSTINIGVNRTGSDVYYTDSTKSATISAQLPNHLKNISNGAWADYTFDKFNSASDINDAMLINGETWYKVTHSFETKEEHQKIYFAIYNNTGSTVYIDDIVLAESIDPEGVNSFETFTVGDHLTYIEAMPTEGTAPNYPENGKWGVVSNNGYITYSDVNDTKSKVANTYVETIYKADGTSALQTEHQGRKVSGWTYENNLTVSTAKAHSGNKSFEIKSADMAYATGFEIDKAGQYTLTYYVNDISAIKNASSVSTGTNFGSAVLSTINIGANRTGSDVYYTDSTKSATISAQLANHLKFAYAAAFVDYTFSKINSAIDFKDAELSNGETWYKVTHSFETKEAHQKVYFAIYNNTGSTVYIDDIVLAEFVEPEPEPEPTPDPEGTISFEGFKNSEHPTYLELTPAEGSAPNYPENGKWGVVSNNGYITYTDITDSKSKIANTYTETIYKVDGTSAVQTEHQGRKVSDWTHENNLTVSTAKAHSGNNSLEIKSADMAYATGFNISKAGKYTITYYVNNLDAIKTASNLSTGTNFGSAVLSAINIGANRTGSDVYYTDSKTATVTAQLPNHLKFSYSGAFVDYTFSKINSAIDFKDAELSNGETWYKVTHAFETKEAHQKVYFAIYNNTGENVYIDDVSVENVPVDDYYISNMLSTAYNNAAALRTAENSSTGKNGLRIYNEIKKEWIEKADIVEFGSIAIRSAKMKDSELTLDTDGSASGVAYKRNKQNMILWGITDDSYIFTSYMTGIPEKYYGDEVLVRTYAIDATGNVYYGEIVALSVFDIANAIDDGNSVNGTNPSPTDKSAFYSFVNANNFANYATWCKNNNKSVGVLFTEQYQ